MKLYKYSYLLLEGDCELFPQSPNFPVPVRYSDMMEGQEEVRKGLASREVHSKYRTCWAIPVDPSDSDFSGDVFSLIFGEIQKWKLGILVFLDNGILWFSISG